MKECNHESVSKKIKHTKSEAVFEGRESAISRGFLAKSYSIYLHDHSFHEINIVLSGEGEHIIGETKIKAAIGDVFVIPPKVPHAYRALSDDFNVYHLILKPEFPEKYFGSASAFSGFRMLFEIEPYLREKSIKANLRLDYKSIRDIDGMLGFISELASIGTAESDALRDSSAIAVIGYLSHKMSENSLGASEDSAGDHIAISRALEYIHTNIQEKITVDALSEVANMSRASFLRKFKSICKTTPSAYILEHRLARARQYIAAGKSKTTAAHAAGFYDLSHMKKYLPD